MHGPSSGEALATGGADGFDTASIVACVGDGTTLPPEAYRSPAFFELEVEAIFRQDWICVGHISQVAAVGDYFTLTLFGEPLVVVRARDGIKALSTVCRHRWVPVVEGRGNAKAFVCPFHKWTYALDGKLIGAPLMGEARAFDRETCRLPEFRCEVLSDLGLVFVTLSDRIAPVERHLESLAARARADGWDLKDQIVVDVQRQDNRYNWKIQAETYVECYHHIGGHETTLQKAAPAHLSWCEAEQGGWTICNTRLNDDVSRLTDEEKAIVTMLAEEAGPDNLIGQQILIYPFGLITNMQTGWDIRILEPIAPDRTRSVTLNTRRRSQIEAPGFDEWLATYNATADVINAEDNVMNERQQLGLASRFAAPGSLSHLEGCVSHLAQYVRAKISEHQARAGH